MNEIDQFRTGRKKHKPTVKKAILEDICSFDIFVSTEYADPTPVYCNLEFGQIIESINGQSFEIGISFAILRIGGRIEVPPGQLKMKSVDGQRSKLKHHELVQTLIYKRMREATTEHIQVDEDTATIPISTVAIEDGDI